MDLLAQSLHTLDGAPFDLRQCAGRVLLIVNTASQCGFTPQYRQLQELHQRYHERGLTVLAFPCNQFGAQESGSPEEIGAFCERNFGLTFPVMEKVEVNGPGAHPLFEQLKQAARGLLGSTAIKWNFTKFLVDRNGKVVRRYAPFTKPARLAGDIERLLSA